MIPKHEIESIVQHVLEQHLGSVLHESVTESMVDDMYRQLLAVQEEQSHDESTPLELQSVEQSFTSLGHQIHTVQYSSGKQRKIIHLTHDVLMTDPLLADLLFAHSQFLNQAQYFSSSIVEATQGAFQLYLKFNGKDFLSSREEKNPYTSVKFAFYEDEYVDIVTWERFESWYHVEQDRPINVTVPR